jgi:hypothetical protein
MKAIRHNTKVTELYPSLYTTFAKILPPRMIKENNGDIYLSDGRWINKKGKIFSKTPQ